MEKQQKVAAVICEYNPFHYGHAHQINIMKENAELCIGIMSGSFVQRGTLATHDKYLRAAAAVEAGLDLVLELPFPYCCSSAADFAAAGVYVAAAVGASHLVFGAEDEGALFDRLSELLEENALTDKAKTLMEADKSLSYPKALSLAAAELGGAKLGEAIARPNNILGLEYVSAIKKGGFMLTPFPIRRKAGLASSSELRAKEDFTKDIPYPQYFSEARRTIYPVEPWLMHLIRHGSYEGLYCIDTTLAATLKKAALDSACIEETVKKATSKVYTAARIRRAILALWLGIETSRVKAKPAFTNLLAANKRGTEHLSKIKKTAGIPIITKPASYKSLCDPAVYEKALRAEELAMLCSGEMTKYSSPLCKTPKIITCY